MYLELPLSGNRGNRRTADATATMLWVHVKLCDLPGPPCRFGRSDERESDDRTVTPNQEVVPTRFAEVGVEVRIVIRSCGPHRDLAV